MSGQPFVISAPSGAGKSSIVSRVMEGVDRLRYSVSHTSRRPRPGERNGVDYHFVGKDAFEKMIHENAFAEWAVVYGALYGTSYADLASQMEGGFDVVLDLDSQGARNIRARFADSVLIYVLPPSFEVLERRLKGRGTESEAALRMRLETARREAENYAWFDFVVINDELPRAVEEVKSIIAAARCRTARRASVVRGMLDRSGEVG